MTLQNFLQVLPLLRRDMSHSYANGAPHKPILLLSICDMMDALGIQENKVPINENLRAKFEQNWTALTQESAKGKFLNPLYRLRTDGFWALRLKNGQEYPSHEPLGLTKTWEQVAYGCFSDEVFPFFQDRETRAIIRETLLLTYFEGVPKKLSVPHAGDGLVKEPRTLYERKWVRPKIWEGFVRDSNFHSNIMRVYRTACAISELRVFGFPLVHACHIVPHAESGDNSISNGIALCINLHAAFDCGLISIGDDFEVLVKSDLKESNSIYRLSKIKGKRINLPDAEKYYPAPELLRVHRNRWGF